MNAQHPTIAFTVGLSNAADGPSHSVYMQAYGMEMQVDDEWPLNLLMMAPPHLVASMTQAAEILSAGMIAGASYTPGDGDYGQVVEAGGRWVLARPGDDLASILSAGLGVLLLVEEAGEAAAAAAVDGLTAESLVVAFKTNSVSTPESAGRAAVAVRQSLPETCAGTSILASVSFEHAGLHDYWTAQGVSGLLFLDATFDAVLAFIDTVVD